MEPDPSPYPLGPVPDDRYDRYDRYVSRQVRPFLSREVVLADHEEDFNMHTDEGLMEFLETRIDAMIDELKQLHPATPLTDQVTVCNGM